MLKALIVILHNLELLPQLLEAWQEIGLPGVTLLPSAGGFHAAKTVQKSGIKGLLGLFDNDKVPQRTIISLIDDEELLERAISEADRVVKGFDSPRTGILFTLDIDRILGLQKWGRLPQEEEDIIEETDHEKENLLKWYQEDIEERYGNEVVRDWSQIKDSTISTVLGEEIKQLPAVTSDTNWQEIISIVTNDPKCGLVCVINNEARLVGMITVRDLAETVLIPVFPELYINSAGGYDKAVQLADSDKLRLAAELMREPFFVNNDETIGTAYEKMRENKLRTLPIVDEHYRLVGSISLQDIMRFCYHT